MSDAIAEALTEIANKQLTTRIKELEAEVNAMRARKRACAEREGKMYDRVKAADGEIERLRRECNALIACRHGEQRCYECPDLKCCDNMAVEAADAARGSKGETMTPEERIESRKICDAASPGPWEYWDNRGRPFWSSDKPKDFGYPPAGIIDGELNQGVQIGKSCDVNRPADCQFVAHARTALPAALDALEELEAAIERLRAALLEAAEMTEFENDRTLIYNHCKQAAEAAGGK